ncbi:MAG: PAS domain S-box protein [Deltaproteobacteria bacterium]|nr:PAS domain S-box protein [Deltaproteobacteria bacterium]
MASDIIFRNILESMSDGVMTIGLDGKILTFNTAAESILGLRGPDVLQRPFAELFLIQEENDAFNQTILNAIYDANTIHDKLVQWRKGDAVLTLEVTTSFLSTAEEGTKKNVAVIVVFNDITEVGRLQESERRLTEELKEKHQALQKSYMEMEETNTNLHTALRKVQLLRIAATVFVIILFVSIGLVTWKQTGISARKTGPFTGNQQGAPASRVYTVAPQPLTDSITLKGTLKPIQIVNITSPFAGMVREKFFEYGQAVTKGTLLLKLDRAETEVKYREAKTAYLEAQEKVKELDNWINSNEMAKAQQSVTRSQLALDGYNKTFQETERLFKKEIVPATEHASAKQQFTTATMDYESSLRELQVVKGKGEGQNKHIAKLKLENAQQKLQDLENQLRHSDIIAPVSGTVLLPDIAGDKDKKGKIADPGVTFSQGDILLAIGNTEGLSMTAEVDELEVLKIKKDQDVRITVDAFGETIKGRVAHISSQAVRAEGGKKAANFEVTIAMDSLPAELRDKLRLGMSANMEILLLNKANAMLLPIQAVLTEGKDHVVTIRDKATQSLNKVRVETGITIIDAVEIISGINVGDEVVY